MEPVIAAEGRRTGKVSWRSRGELAIRGEPALQMHDALKLDRMVPPQVEPRPKLSLINATAADMNDRFRYSGSKRYAKAVRLLWAERAYMAGLSFLGGGVTQRLRLSLWRRRLLHSLAIFSLSHSWTTFLMLICPKSPSADAGNCSPSARSSGRLAA